jgi:hypothetical protein
MASSIALAALTSQYITLLASITTSAALALVTALF